MKDRRCWNCTKLYTPSGPAQKYCGSRREKKGCAHKLHKVYNDLYLKQWSKKNPDKIKAYAKKNNARKKRIGYWRTEEFRKKNRERVKAYRAKKRNEKTRS